MLGKLSPSPFSEPSNSESGFGLVEVLVSMLIFLIAAVGIGGILISSNHQLTTVEYALQNQQYAMQATATSATGSVASVGIGIQPVPQTVNVAVNQGQTSQPTGCTSLMSMMLNFMACMFGSCGGTTSPAATSVVVQVPTASLSSSFSALPSNQQPPAWWQP